MNNDMIVVSYSSFRSYFTIFECGNLLDWGIREGKNHDVDPNGDTAVLRRICHVGSLIVWDDRRFDEPDGFSINETITFQRMRRRISPIEHL